MTSHPFTLAVLDGEPRIYDLDLAKRLGFESSLNIRNLIKRNQDKLLKFGVLFTVEKTSGELGGRPTFAFYPNQKQSIWLCMKSETDNAFDVQVEIVRVFDAYLNGDIKSGATLASQPRMYFAASRIARNLEVARSIGGRAALHDQLRTIHQQLGLPPIMPVEMFGKPADQGDQLQMEV